LNQRLSEWIIISLVGYGKSEIRKLRQSDNEKFSAGNSEVRRGSSGAAGTIPTQARIAPLWNFKSANWNSRLRASAR